MTTALKTAIIICFLIPVSSLAQSDDSDWQHWRGPEGTGVLLGATPPLEWSEEKNIQWKVPIDGEGIATPIIVDSKVFVLTAIKTDRVDPELPKPEDQPKTNFFDVKKPNAFYQFVVLCLDRKTGKELWRKVANELIPHEGVHHDNKFASASPVTDGERLYCWFGSAGLFCFDLDGNEIWKRDFGKTIVGSSLGEGTSPAIHDGKLIIVRDTSKNPMIYCLDAADGKTIWEKKRDEKNTWATPRIVTRNMRTQVITPGSNFVRSYDLDTGDLIWQCSGMTGNCIPCPIVEGDTVYCMSGYKGYSLLAIGLNGEGDVSDSDAVKWSRKEGTPYIPSAVLLAGRLYFIQSNSNILTVLDSKTGEVVVDRTRIPGVKNVYASPVASKDRVYITGRSGTTKVLKSGDKFEVLATNKLAERVDASPALAGNQIFLRGERSLYCIAEDE